MSDRSRPYQICLVGCGRISGKHFDAIENSTALELAGVCDLVPSRAKAASEKYGVPAFETLEEMLKGVESDLVAITTPSGLHPAHGILAAQAGRHVVCEKPMAISLESADALLEACEVGRVQLFVVKQNRLNPTIRLLKSAVSKGRFGRIFMANATVRWTRPQAYYDLAPWRGTWALDGGAFMNQASHYIDLIQWLIGPVQSVSAKTATLARDIEAEDTGAALLHFQNGAIGVLEVTMLTYPKNLEGSLTILGEKGTVKIGGTAVNRVDHWEFEDYDDDDKLVEDADTRPADVYGFGHGPYYENVVAVLDGLEEPDTNGVSGRKSLELILGAYESARTGKTVTLPFQP